jgi:hypothetical protein
VGADGGWASATAKAADTPLQWCMRQTVDGRYHACQHRVKARARLCGVTVGQAFHGALEVGAQQGNLRVLACQSAACGQHLLGQRGRGVGERCLREWL